MHEPQPHTPDEYGDDAHPAFGLLGASRIQTSPPGTVLFDSDVRHQNTVIIKLSSATRKRDLNRDWIHSRRQLFEIEMSEAQWASFVSSMNTGDGVPVTIRAVPGDYDVPGVTYDPRLAHSLRETRVAAHDAFDAIENALAAYVKTIADKAPAKERNAALSWLEAMIHNAVPNVDYAGKTLAKHAEDVVQKARADLEAMVLNKAHQLGISAGDLGGNTLAIGAGDEGEDR